MTEILGRYLFAFFHPFQVQEQLRKEREKSETGHLVPVELSDQKDNIDAQGVEYYEALSISWLFNLLNAFYSVVSVLVGVYSYELLYKKSEFLLALGRAEQGSFLFKLILGVVLFPLSTWIWVKLWGVLIKFFAKLLDISGDIDRITDEITRNALVGHTLLIVPVFGGIAKYIAGLIFIYAGLTRNLSLSALQSLVVLVSPVLILLVLFFLLFISLIMPFIGT